MWVPLVPLAAWLSKVVQKTRNSSQKLSENYRKIIDPKILGKFSTFQKGVKIMFLHVPKILGNYRKIIGSKLSENYRKLSTLFSALH